MAIGLLASLAGRSTLARDMVRPELAATLGQCAKHFNTIRAELEVDFRKRSGNFHSIAEKLKIQPLSLVCAIIDQESDGRNLAIRPEPRLCSRVFEPHHERYRGYRELYRWFYRDYGNSDPDTAKERFCASYGLMQLNYVSMLDEGFRGPPEQLLEPKINIHYGILHLQTVYERVIRRRAKELFGKKRFAPEELLTAEESLTLDERLRLMLRLWNGPAEAEITEDFAKDVEDLYDHYEARLSFLNPGLKSR